MSTSEEKHARMDEWGNMKKYLNDRKAADIPKYKDGEIWWVAVGENVGIEINGKGGQFSRPVLVYKKFSDEGFAGIPLTSKKTRRIMVHWILFSQSKNLGGTFSN